MIEMKAERIPRVQRATRNAGASRQMQYVKEVGCTPAHVEHDALRCDVAVPRRLMHGHAGTWTKQEYDAWVADGARRWE